MLDIASQYEGECHEDKCCINAAAFVTVCEKAVDKIVTASYAVQGNKLTGTDSGGGVSAARYWTAHMQTNDTRILHEQLRAWSWLMREIGSFASLLTV